MSLQVPLRIKIEQGGVTKGYVETLDFSSGVTVNGPVAHVTAGGGGGDANTLQGHPASFFATEADLTTLEGQVADLEARSLMWGRLGILVQTTAPPSGITYADWLAGTNGYWGWIQLP